MKMKNLIFCVAMNFISAIVLIGAGAMEYILHPLFIYSSYQLIET